jgi:hypothetical protein
VVHVDCGAGRVVSVACGSETVVCGGVTLTGTDTVVSGGETLTGEETVVWGAVCVVHAGDDTGDGMGELVTAVGEPDTVVATGPGLVVVVGSGPPPDAEVAAMATVPAPSTPAATAAATMVRRDRSTAGIRMECPLDQRI